jgi:hypothetical protein
MHGYNASGQFLNSSGQFFFVRCEAYIRASVCRLLEYNFTQHVLVIDHDACMGTTCNLSSPLIFLTTVNTSIHAAS